MPGLPCQSLLRSEISSPALSHVHSRLGERCCISGESTAPSCVTEALLVLAPVNSPATLCIWTPQLRAQTHPTCTINSPGTSSCSLLFFTPPACTGRFPGCKVVDQHLQAATNGAGRTDEASLPPHALGQTLHGDGFAGRQEKLVMTYCCNSVPDEAVGFEVSKYI